jgi:hypothetical protein
MSAALDHYANELQQRLNVRLQPVQVEQYVRVSEAALRAPSVVGVRVADKDPFTGWQVVATSEVPAQATFGVLKVRELASEHPAWLLGLQLPTGWAFRFAGNTLVDCVSEDGETHSVRISVDEI